MISAFVFPLTKSFPLYRFATWSGPGMILLFLYLFRGVHRNKFRIKNFDWWEYSIISIIIIYVIMTLFGQNFLNNLPHLSHYLSCLILSIYFRRIYGELFTIKNLIFFALITIGLEAIIGLIQQITTSEFGNLSVYIGEKPETDALNTMGDTAMGRIHGTFGTGNLTGSWIIVFLPFILYGKKIIDNKQYWIIRNVVVILSMVVVMLTISRFSIAAYFSILCFPLLVNLFKKKKKYLKLKLRLPSVVFALFIFFSSISAGVIFWDSVLLMKQLVDYRFSMTFEEASELGEMTGGVDARMEMNIGAMQAFMRSPIIGLGYKNSRWIWPTVDANVPTNWVWQPHNLYMIMLVEGGIFLFIAYAFYTLFPFYKFWQLRKSKDSMILAYFLSLGACMGIQMIYITFTGPHFACVYTMIQGCAMGHCDRALKNLKVNNA